MALPLITTESIRDTIKSKLSTFRGCSSVEIFTEFPQDMTQARHGIYVGDPITSTRVPYSLAVNYGGNIYICTDMLDIIFVSFQGDNLLNTVTQAITDLVFDNTLLDGYHERDYNIAVENKNRAEYRTIVFELKRMEFQ